MTTDERLDAIEARLNRTDELLDRLSQQNQLLAASVLALANSVASIKETTGVLGSYINASVDYLQHHETNPDAHA